MDGKVRYLYKEIYMVIYTTLYDYIYIYVYTIVWLYNHDRIHRICTCSTLRVWTEKKTNIRIFMNIWGRNMWGKILECTNTAKANTIGITMFPYRKHVWNPADWHFFRNWFESQAAAAIHASVKNLGNGLFPGSKMDSLHILCTFFRFRKMLLFYVYLFFTDSGKCFLRPKLSILYSMYPIMIIYVHTYFILS